MTTHIAAGLVLGYAADLVVGDPRRGHPVAVFGSVAAALERRVWADRRTVGAAYTAVCVIVPTVAAHAISRGLRSRPAWHAAFVGLCTWSALGGRSLRIEGATMARLLGDSGGSPAAALDLHGARRRLAHLCSRDATDLSVAELARATVESLAENTSDAVVAPLLWGAVAGAPGIVAYRAANTLDAMVGYRTRRHAKFGWASARLDDVLNVVPSRLTAALTVLLAPAVGGRRSAAWRAWRRDAPAHPSPNAGPVEASAAGALGIVLGGSNRYSGRVEDRGHLGANGGREVEVSDIRRAAALTSYLGVAGLVVSVVVALTIDAVGASARHRIRPREGNHRG